MKYFLLLLTPLLIQLPTEAQQTNIYPVCRDYVEKYKPGYYDSNGNYVRGRVETFEETFPCPNQGPVGYQQNGYVQRCGAPAAVTTLGGLIGGGIAAVSSKPDAYGWSIPLGAVLGMGLGQAVCQ